jgi:hypothetical protein
MLPRGGEGIEAAKQPKSKIRKRILLQFMNAVIGTCIWVGRLAEGAYLDLRSQVSSHYGRRLVRECNFSGVEWRTSINKGTSQVFMSPCTEPRTTDFVQIP